MHEVQLRLDMAKMRFNYLMVKFKLHKIFKRFMYQKKDFYFMNSSLEQERQNNHIVRNIKGINNAKNSCKCFDTKSQSDNSSTYASSIDNNYSRIDDDEASPLKI